MKLERAWWATLFVVAILAPLPLGSVETEWAMPLALAALALGGWAVGTSAPRTFPAALVPVLLLVVWTTIAVVPLPRGIVGFLSPERLTVPPIPGESGPLTLSLYPGGTLEQTLLLVAVLYLMWGVVRASPRPAFRLVAAVGAAHAILSLVLQETGGTGPVAGTDTTRIAGWYVANEVLMPFGTYVNKNHHAGLMLIGAGGCLAVLLRRGRRTFRVRGKGRIGRTFFRLGIPGAGLLVILIALFASGSRGASAALLLGVLGSFGLCCLVRRRIRWGPVAAGLVLLVGSLLVARAGSSTSVLERLDAEGRLLNRPRLWRDCVVMTGRYPVFGIGAGSFEVGFPRYQTFDEERRFTHAEGDWVQVLAENGVPGALFLFAFGIVLIRRFLRLVRGGGTNAALAAGGFVGVLGVLGHGCLDTGLHMPANLVAAAVLTAGFLCIGTGVADRAGKSGLSPLIDHQGASS